MNNEQAKTSPQPLTTWPMCVCWGREWSSSRKTSGWLRQLSCDRGSPQHPQCQSSPHTLHKHSSSHASCTSLPSPPPPLIYFPLLYLILVQYTVVVRGSRSRWVNYFTLIITFNPHNSPMKYYYYLHSRDEEPKTWKWPKVKHKIKMNECMDGWMNREMMEE